LNRFFLCFFLLFLADAPLQAQSFKGGITAGFAVSQVSGDNLSGFNKPGSLAGAYIFIEPSAKWRIELQMIHLMKGSYDAARPDRGDFFSYSMTLHYVEIPIMFRYFYKKLWWGFGLSEGYLAASNVKNQDGKFPEGSPDARPFKKFETSANISVLWPFSERFELEARFNQSILPIRNHLGNVVFQLNRGQYNTVLAACLRFRLGKIESL